MNQAMQEEAKEGETGDKKKKGETINKGFVWTWIKDRYPKSITVSSKNLLISLLLSLSN